MGQSTGSYGTRQVWGNNVPVFEASAMRATNAVGPQYTGPGYSPLQTIPPSQQQGKTMGSNGAGYAPGMTSGGNGGGSGFLRGLPGSTSARVALAVMLVVGLLWLRYVHW